MINLIKSLYYELPIRLKLQLWYMPLLIITVGSIGFVSYTTASHQVLEKISRSQESLSLQTISHTDYLARDIYDIYNYLSLSTELQDLITLQENYKSAGVAYSMINRLMSTRQSFQSLLIYSENRPTIKFNSMNNNDILNYEDYKNSDYYQKTISRISEGTWGVETDDFKLFIGDERKEVFYSKKLINIGNMEPMGLMIIGMNEDLFRQTYNSSKEANLEIFILNQDGQILSNSHGNWSGRNFSELPYYDQVAIDQVDWNKSNKEWIVSHSASKLTGWHVLVIQPRIEELKQVKKIRQFTFGIVLLIVLINIPISWYISTMYTRPIMRILKSMRELQLGDFNQKVQIELRDEIGQLGHGYNIMVLKIKELFQNVYESELSKKEAELRLLQAQINPHFLYNTLNSISWMLHREGSEEKAEMIQRISDFFRFSLNQGADLITVEKEIKIVENYLFLSKLRFGDKLIYSIEADEQLKPMFIPKLILQPLVENSIVHGIEPMKGQGFVSVVIRQSEDEALFTITDNGMGISSDLLERIQKGISMKKKGVKPESVQGFAVINVRDRIMKQFGEEASITISSRESVGTAITIRIPLKTSGGMSSS